MTRRTALAALASASCAFGKGYRIEKLWKSPDGNPNGLEATPEGLWVGEQVTDRAYLLDWKNGKVLQKVETESSNTSGIAYGGGYLWMAANGKATFRKPKPTDAKSGEIVKVDPKTGHTVARYPNPDGGGLHGLAYKDGMLWMTCFKWQVLAMVDASTFEVKHKIPVSLGRAHGLAIEGNGIWCDFSNDFVLQKFDMKDGHVLDEIKLNKETDPDPHGLDIYKGELYYCDAGIAPGPKFTDLPSSGYISKIHRL